MSPIANTFPRAQSELGSVAVTVLPSESVNTEIYMRTIFIIVHDVFFKRAVVCITLTDILGVTTLCGLVLLTAWPGKKYNSV